MEALGIARCNDWWVLGVAASRTHLDSRARCCYNLSVTGSVAANIFLTVVGSTSNQTMEYGPNLPWPQYQLATFEVKG
jgi:hypothetical protein